MACDVIYHRYPSKDFDPAEKPIPVAVAVEAADTDNEDTTVDACPSSSLLPLAPSPPGCCQSSCSRLGRLLVFHMLAELFACWCSCHSV